MNLAVRTIHLQRFEYRLATVPANEKLSDELMVGAVSCFVSGDIFASLAEELRVKTGIHDGVFPSPRE